MTAAIVAQLDPPGAGRKIRLIPGLDFIGHVALLLVLVFAFLAAFGPLIAPHDPNAVDLSRSYWGPDAEHPLGYDQQGRDIFSRLLYGARSSFLGPLIIVVVATTLGMTLALIGAWRKGWIDAALAGILDSSLAFPGLLLAVMVVAIVGPGIQATVIALAIAYTPYMARIVRSAALAEINKDYVAAAKVQGFSGLVICVRHVIPNILPIVLGQAVLTVAWATVDIAGLSFLGLGIQPPAADWGIMLANGQTGVLQGYPTEALAAGLSLVIAICSFSLLGERITRRGEVLAA
ncbi:ABC transporter permease [Agromyces endophyticus]|uniref:ABC transporter permease n=1 Tax=Agromyces sp. H17E-10 TaxID=2932244 RepID=UPI001FD0BFEF|nr:ABC transporter permease [Agromyces sp. H17E-10]UOQ89187.1 ABC transporter permease [Agromyces sp. H17E-10]